MSAGRRRVAIDHGNEHVLGGGMFPARGASAAAPVIDTTVVRDAVQPGRELRRRCVALAVGDHADPDVLEHVRRGGFVAKVAQDESPQRRAMA